MNEQPKNEQQNILSALLEAERKDKPVAQPPKFKDVGKLLTEKVKSLIFWIGTLCTIISGLAYILIVIIRVVGFNSTAEFLVNLVFALITAFIGLLISQFLRLQGVSFAKNEPEVKAVWEQYYGRKSKKRKYRSLTYFWVKSTIFDIVFKSTSMIAINLGTVYFFVKASGDAMQILMALFNLTFFIGFGMVLLTKAYDFTREQHVAWMRNQIELQAEVPEE